MKALLDQKQSRREFLQTLGRYVFLGGLVSASGIMIAGKRHDGQDPDYNALQVCQKCAWLQKCQQPQAISLKQKLMG